MRQITVFFTLAIAAVFLVSLNASAEPDYENPELEIKFNLKEDKESLTPQNKLPTDPEAKSTGRSQYDQWPGFRNNREPTKVGTWTSDPVEFGLSISLPTMDIWWQGKDPDYEADCEWTFYIHQNDQQVSENTETCSSNGDDLVRETYNVGTTLELAAGDTFAIELWYEGWEDVDIYHDNSTYDTGINAKGSHNFFFAPSWAGNTVTIEFAEAWPVNWDTNLDGGYIMLMGDDMYMADNSKANIKGGNDYSIQMTNGSAEITSVIIQWTEVSGNGIRLLMDYNSFDHAMGGNNTNGTAGNPPILTINLQKASGALGDEGGLLGLPGFELMIAIPAIAFVARRYRTN